MPNNKSLPNGSEVASDRFESDTQKIVRKHLEDKDHVISEEEIRNVRVGMTPPNEERHLDEIVEEIEAEDETKKDSKEKPADDPITPWDTIDH